MTDLLDGTKIVLERMKTNPEEFVNKKGKLLDEGKWGWIVNTVWGLERKDGVYKSSLPSEDIEAIQASFIQLIRDAFSARVLRVLTGAEEKEDEERGIAREFLKNQAGQGVAAPLGKWDTNTLMNGTISYEEYEKQRQRQLMNSIPLNSVLPAYAK